MIPFSIHNDFLQELSTRLKEQILLKLRKSDKNYESYEGFLQSVS